jgi:Fe-S cluster assembly iron-binding protein IscA
MNKLIIDQKAIEFMKDALTIEKADAMRIFISGGGCCRQFEIAPVRKALKGDVTFVQDGITVHIEKGLAENASSATIRFDERKGLLIEFAIQENP